MEPIVKSLVAQNAILSSRLTALERLIARGAIDLDIDPVADPAPDGGGLGGAVGGVRGPFVIPDIPIHWDPAPEELSKLSRVQLESRLGDIANLRRKLDGLESLVKDAAQRAGG
jgi:hypothetical protein